MIKIASAKLGVVLILPFSLVLTPPPATISPDESGLWWGWCVVDGPSSWFFRLKTFRAASAGRRLFSNFLGMPDPIDGPHCQEGANTSV